MNWQGMRVGNAFEPAFGAALALFLTSLLLLAAGNAGLHVYSGKDEYFLSIRTVLSMHEQDRWWMPFLDGEPRLRKPPGLYWLGRASVESCGTSLYCLRLPAMIWAGVWSVACFGLARWLYPISREQAGLATACVLLSSLGFLIEGRRLMLDLPMTAASTLALWGSWRFLAPQAPPRHQAIEIPHWLSTSAWTLCTAFALAVAMLIKGPAGLLVWATGLCFVLVVFPQLRRQRLAALALHLLCVLTLSIAATLPWFFSALAYSEEVASIASEEMHARQFGGLSLSPLWGLWLIASPWLIAVLYWIFKSLSSNQWAQDGFDHRRVALGLLLWLFASLMPFFFMRSFERYLLGSLVPMILVIPMMLLRGRQILECIPGWIRFISAMPMIVIVVAVQWFAIWFELERLWPALIPLLLIGVFTVIWWRAKSLLTIALAIAFWILNIQIFVSISYPNLRINDAPSWLVEHAKEQEVVYFGGPHPAMLSAVTGRSHRHVSPNDLNPLKAIQSGTWIVLQRSDVALLQALAARGGLDAHELGRWKALVNQGSAFRFARPGASWELAIKRRDLQELTTELIVFKISPKGN